MAFQIKLLMRLEFERNFIILTKTVNEQSCRNNINDAD